MPPCQLPLKANLTRRDSGVVTVTVWHTLLRRPEAAFKSRLMGYSNTLSPPLLGTPLGRCNIKRLRAMTLLSSLSLATAHSCYRS